MKRFLIFLTLTLMLFSCSNNNNHYEILKEQTSMNICRLQIKLDKRVTKNELTKLAKELRKSRKGYNKLWISFYLPDLLPDKSGNGAWAIANFTPNLDVEILSKDKPAEGYTKKELKFPKYKTVMDMLIDAQDFKNECLKKISKNGEPLHIRVSTEFLAQESVANMKEQVKRDIVYVVFQAFAETDIDKITVTSIPIVRKSFNPNVAYDGKLIENLKQTVTINRKKALKILKKYLQTNSFQDLYQLKGTLYLPNTKFDRLQFSELNNVFKDLKH